MGIMDIQFRVTIGWVIFMLVICSMTLFGDGPWIGRAADFMAVAALLMSIYVSVILHELGHAVAANWFGYKCNSITLDWFGGMASMAKMPETPYHELLVIGAGPCINLILWIATLPFSGEWIRMFGNIQLVLGLFNLLPVFPMDGGRLMRAMFHKYTGDFVKATWMAMIVTSVSLPFLIIVALKLGIYMVVAILPLAAVWGWYEYSNLSELRFRSEINNDCIRMLRQIELLPDDSDADAAVGVSKAELRARVQKLMAQTGIQ